MCAAKVNFAPNVTPLYPPMALIDTHAHIYEAQFQNDVALLIQQLQEAGVSCVLMPNVDANSIGSLVAMAALHSGFKIMLGLHPTYVKEDFKSQLAIIEAAIPIHDVKGIGEIGLDFFWDTAFASQQKMAFEMQLGWAVARGLPVSIHSRNATTDCINMVSRFGGKVRGVFHCFSGSLREAEAIMQLDMHLGIGGNLTYKNNPVRDFIHTIPLDRIVLETDSPYLAPVPKRGKPNSPAYLPYICSALASLQGCTEAEVEQATTRNAKAIFGL